MSERGPVMSLIEARHKIERRECWAASYRELGPSRDCLTTALGLDWEAHAMFCRANSLDDKSVISSVVHFNDTHSHEEVLAGLDRAIGVRTITEF